MTWARTPSMLIVCALIMTSLAHETYPHLKEVSLLEEGLSNSTLASSPLQVLTLTADQHVLDVAPGVPIFSDFNFSWVTAPGQILQGSAYVQPLMKRKVRAMEVGANATNTCPSDCSGCWGNIQHPTECLSVENGQANVNQKSCEKDSGVWCPAVAPTSTSPTSNCNWNCYLERYPDLQIKFGTNIKEAEKHYKKYGMKQERNCECPSEPPTGAPSMAPTVEQCSSDGGSTFKTDQPSIGYVCCANTCGKGTSVPVGAGWTEMAGAWPLGGLTGKTCTFWSKGFLPGDHLVCCSECWGSGTLLQNKELGSCVHSSGPIRCRDSSVTIGDLGGNTSGVSAEELVQCASWESQHGNWIRKEGPCGGSCHHANGPVSCKDAKTVAGGDETMRPATLEELATCASWSSQGGGWTYSTDPCISEEPAPGVLQVRSMSTEQKITSGDMGVAIFENKDFKWSTAPAGILAITTYVQPVNGPRDQDGEVGDTCAEDSECKGDGACALRSDARTSVLAASGCENKCLAVNASERNEASENCPAVEEKGDTCSTVGGSVFTIDRPSIAYVCCSNTCDKGTNIPVGDGWSAMDGSWAVEGLPETPCTFWRKGMLPGEHTVCCSQCWGSGALIKKEEEGIFIGGADIVPQGIEQSVIWARTASLVWGDTENTFSEAPHGVLENKYVRSNKEIQATPAEHSGLMAGCPKGGGSQFSIGQPMEAFVCCSLETETEVEENTPGNAWVKLDGAFPLTGSGQCSFFRRTLSSGEHSVCCGQDWASGVFLRARSPVFLLSHWSGDGAADGAGLDLGDKPELQITGDQTIAMWVKPTFIGKMTAYDKCYGGEGAITIEENGRATYYYGTAGSAADPSQIFESSFVLEQKVWTHIAIVRDLAQMKLRWYVNGVLSNEAAAEYAAASVSSLSAMVGKGFSDQTFKGAIEQLQIFNYALAAEDVGDVMAINSPVAIYKLKDFVGDGSEDHLPIQLGNKGVLQLTGEMTIATWIKVNSLSDQALVTKAGSGEFSLTVAAGGHLVYSYGISGALGTDTDEKMQSLSSNFRLVEGSWMHIAVVRDLSNGVLIWYINGQEANQASARFEYALKSSGGVVVGGVDDKSISNLLGELAELQIFGKALRPSEVKALSRMDKPDPVYQLAEYAGDGTAESEWVDVGNRPELQITGDQTIAMWIKTRFNGKQNPFGKCYGGEGALQIEANGKVDYYYGTSGEREEPFQEFQSGFVLVQNTWTHIAVVRDLKTMKLLWYENGQLSNEEDAQYEAAAESSLGATVGKGFTGRYFNGKIHNLRVYNRALSPLEVTAVKSSYSPVPLYSLSSLKLDGSPGFIPLQVLSEPQLRIEGDQTIMFWLQPASIGQKMQIYSQCFGGEGSVMLEETGALTYSYGTSGARQDPFQQVPSNSVMEPEKWQHVAIVRDFSGKQLRWYLNGELTNEVPTSYEAAKASSFAITIGSGPDGHSYLGKIAELRLYNRAVESDELLVALRENSPMPVFEYAAWVGDGTADSPAIDIGNKPELQISGDQTVAMWLRPNFHGEMTPYGKCFGGEGSVTVEEDGKVKYYYGTAGEREQPFQGFTSGFELLERRWTHIAVVRDLVQMKLRWYVNGKLSNEEDAQFARAEISTLSATVGKGFEGKFFDGEIRNLRVYNRALEDDELLMETTVDSPLPLYTMQQWSRIDGSDDAPVNVGALPTLQITGDQTIAVWVKARESTGTMALFTKASGGEGSLVLEANGKVRYSYGMSGTDYNVEEEDDNAMGADPGEQMQQFTSEFAVPPNAWSHVTVVRDFTAKKVKFFLDGAPINTAATEFLRAKASDLGAWVGKGQEGEVLEGALYNLRVYNRALPNSEVDKLSKSSNPGPVYEISDWSGDGTVEAETIDVGDKPELRITGDQTIAMWIKPTFNGRMNPFSKCFGGEGTVTVEENGKVSYYYGTSGERAEPFQEFQSEFSLVQHKWTHITVVRDLESLQLRWYVNGQMSNEAAADYAEATISSLSATVGKGYEDKYFNGQIRNLRVYNRALQQSEVTQIKMSSSPVPIYELQEFLGDGTPEHTQIDLEDKPEFRIGGDLTVVAWVKPVFNEDMGVLSKCTGGEGSLQVLVDGRVKYSYGTSGTDDTAPMQVMESVTAVPQASWSLVVLVRDLENMRLRMYIDGKLDVEASAEYANAAVTSEPLVLGHAFTGRMFGLKLFNIALSAADAEAERWGVNPGPVYQMEDWSGDGTIDSEPIDAGNKPELQITGDQTISMWMRPTFSGKMNPFSKCYGGEGSITVEEDGKVNYFYGTAGSRAEPYQTFQSGFVLEEKIWTHIAVVRDLKAMKLLWYVNGELSNEATADYAAAKVSTLSATVGKGFTEKFFKGSLAYLQVYNRALPQEEIARYATETTPTCNGEVKLYGGDIGEQWTAGFVEGIYPTDVFLAHGASVNAASSIDVPKNCEAWLYGENLAGWESVITPGSYNTAAFIKLVKDNAVQSIKVTAYDLRAHDEREEAKAREAAKQAAIEGAKTSEQAAEMAETAQDEAQDWHDALGITTKGLMTDSESAHVKSILATKDEEKLHGKIAPMLATYEALKDKLTDSVTALTQAKADRAAAFAAAGAAAQAFAVAQIREESATQGDHDAVATHKGAKSHEATVLKHSTKSKASLAEVQKIDLNETVASTDIKVKTSSEQSAEADKQLAEASPFVPDGEATVEQVQQIEDQGKQSVKDVKIELKIRQKTSAAATDNMIIAEHKVILADKRVVSANAKRLKHEAEQGKIVDKAERKLTEAKPHVPPSQAQMAKAATKLQQKEEAQQLAAQHFETVASDLIKAQQSATEAAAGEKEKRNELMRATGVFQEADTKAQAAKERLEQATIVETRAKRNQDTAKERGDRAIKSAHSIWTDSEVVVEDAHKQVRVFKKTAMKAKSALARIPYVKSQEELEQAKAELEDATKVHKQAFDLAAAKTQALNQQELIYEAARAALQIIQDQLVDLMKAKDVAVKKSREATMVANGTDAVLVTFQRKTQVDKSDLKVASDKLTASETELALTISINKAKDSSKIQAIDNSQAAQLKLQELQAKAESTKHASQQGEKDYQEQRERFSVVKQKHTEAKSNEEQVLSAKQDLEKRSALSQQKLQSLSSQTEEAAAKTKTSEGQAQEAQDTNNKARAALQQANAAAVQALREEHEAQTEEQKATLGARIQVPLAARAEESNTAAKERVVLLTNQTSESDTKRTESMKAAQEAVVAAKRAETKSKDAAVLQTDSDSAEIQATGALAEALEDHTSKKQQDCDTRFAVASKELESSAKLLHEAKLFKADLSKKLQVAQAEADKEEEEEKEADQKAKEAEETAAEGSKAAADAESEVNTAGPKVEQAIENYRKVLESAGEHKTKVILDKAKADVDALRKQVTDQATQLTEKAALVEAKGKADFDELVTSSQKQASAAEVASEEEKMKNAEAEQKAEQEAQEKETQQHAAAQQLEAKAISSVGDLMETATAKAKDISIKASLEEGKLQEQHEQHISEVKNRTQEIDSESQRETARINAENKASEIAVADAVQKATTQRAAAKEEAAQLISAAEKESTEKHSEALSAVTSDAAAVKRANAVVADMKSKSDEKLATVQKNVQASNEANLKLKAEGVDSIAKATEDATAKEAAATKEAADVTKKAEEEAAIEQAAAQAKVTAAKERGVTAVKDINDEFKALADKAAQVKRDCENNNGTACYETSQLVMIDMGLSNGASETSQLAMIDMGLSNGASETSQMVMIDMGQSLETPSIPPELIKLSSASQKAEATHEAAAEALGFAAALMHDPHTDEPLPELTGNDVEIHNARAAVLAAKKHLSNAEDALSKAQQGSSAAVMARDAAALKLRDVSLHSLRAHEAASYLEQQFNQATEEASAQDEAHAHVAEVAASAQKEKSTCVLAKAESTSVLREAQTKNLKAKRDATAAAKSLQRSQILEGATSLSAEHSLATAKQVEINAAMMEQRLAEAKLVAKQASESTAAAASMKSTADSRQEAAKQALPKATEKATVASQISQNAEKEQRSASNTLDLAEAAFTNNNQRLGLMRAREEGTKVDVDSLNRKIKRAKKASAKKRAVVTGIEPQLAERLEAKNNDADTLKQLQAAAINDRDVVQNQTHVVRNSESEVASAVVAAKATALRQTEAVADVAGKAAAESAAVEQDKDTLIKLEAATENARANRATAVRMSDSLAVASKHVEEKESNQKTASAEKAAVLKVTLNERAVAEKFNSKAVPLKKEFTAASRKRSVAETKFQMARGESSEARARVGQTNDRVAIAEGEVVQAKGEEVSMKQELAAVTTTTDEKINAEKLIVAEAKKKRQVVAKAEAEIDSEATDLRGQMDLADQHHVNAERKAVTLTANSVRTSELVRDAQVSTRETSVSAKAAAKIHNTAVKRWEFAKGELKKAEDGESAAKAVAKEVETADAARDKSTKEAAALSKSVLQERKQAAEAAAKRVTELQRDQKQVEQISGTMHELANSVAQSQGQLIRGESLLRTEAQTAAAASAKIASQQPVVNSAASQVKNAVNEVEQSTSVIDEVHQAAVEHSASATEAAAAAVVEKDRAVKDLEKKRLTMQQDGVTKQETEDKVTTIAQQVEELKTQKATMEEDNAVVLAKYKPLEVQSKAALQSADIATQMWEESRAKVRPSKERVTATKKEAHEANTKAALDKTNLLTDFGIEYEDEILPPVAPATTSGEVVTLESHD